MTCVQFQQIKVDSVFNRDVAMLEPEHASEQGFSVGLSRRFYGGVT